MADGSPVRVGENVSEFEVHHLAPEHEQHDGHDKKQDGQRQENKVVCDDAKGMMFLPDLERAHSDDCPAAGECG